MRKCRRCGSPDGGEVTGMARAFAWHARRPTQTPPSRISKFDTTLFLERRGLPQCPHDTLCLA